MTEMRPDCSGWVEGCSARLFGVSWWMCVLSWRRGRGRGQYHVHSHRGCGGVAPVCCPRGHSQGHCLSLRRRWRSSLVSRWEPPRFLPPSLVLGSLQLRCATGDVARPPANVRHFASAWLFPGRGGLVFVHPEGPVRGLVRGGL